MNIARVVGRVWATRKLSDLENLKLLILQPMEIREGRDVGELIVAADSQQAGVANELVYYVTSKEASFPFNRRYTALDAAIVGHVDHVDLPR